MAPFPQSFPTKRHARGNCYVTSRRLRDTTKICVAALLLAPFLFLPMTNAQQNPAQTLAQKSAIVVQGSILKSNASDEPMVAASSSTAVIKITRMFAGSEIAGDQTGHTATVILSKPGAMKVGEEGVFFGNPRVVGRSLTIADEGEIAGKGEAMSLTVLPDGLQGPRDRVIQSRIKEASLVFRGMVEAVKPVESRAERQERAVRRPSEHDPEWQAASVRILEPLQGGKEGETVTVLFSGSKDIVWFNAPKLKPQQEAVFVAHRAQKEEAAGLPRLFAEAAEGQATYLVTEPTDVQPVIAEERIRTLLVRAKETHQ